MTIELDSAAPPERPLETPAVHTRLRSQFLWTLTGNVVYALCQWGMLVAIAKSLPPEAVGQFSLGLAIAAPILMLANLQLRALQATDVLHRFDFRDYLGLRVLTSSGAFVAIVTVGSVMGLARSTLWVVLAVGAAKCLESLSDALYGQLQKHERMNLIAIAMMLKGGLALLLLGAVLLATGSLPYAVLALALTWATALVGWERRFVARTILGTPGARVALAPRFDATTLRRLAWTAFPMGLASVLLVLTQNIPRYFLERTHGEATLGYFAALAYPTVALGIVVGAMGQAMAPRLARAHLVDRQHFRRLVLMLSALSAALAGAGLAVAALAGPRLLASLYRPDYAEHFDVFLLLIVSAGVWSLHSALGYAATASGRLKGQGAAALAIVLGSALATAFLVPAGGLRGAAISLIASGAIAYTSFAVLLVLRGDRR